MTARSFFLSAAATALLLAAGCTQQAVGADSHPLLIPEGAMPTVTEPHELYRMHEEAKKSAPAAGDVASF